MATGSSVSKDMVLIADAGKFGLGFFGWEFTSMVMENKNPSPNGTKGMNMSNINETVMMTVISTLGEKVQALQKEMAATEARLLDQIDQLEDQVSDDVIEINARRTEGSHYKEEIERLRDICLKGIGTSQGVQIPSPEEAKKKADAYMAEKGCRNFKPDESWEINHINNIKEVRSITGWSLLETKNYCEDWMRTHGFHQEPNGRGWTLLRDGDVEDEPDDEPDDLGIDEGCGIK